MKFACDYCGAVFSNPAIVRYTEHLGENLRRSYSDERCPICGCCSFCEISECKNCGSHTEVGEILCHKCKRSLKKRIVDFFDTLTYEEEQQFDEWMDGDTVTNRRNWK